MGRTWTLMYEQRPVGQNQITRMNRGQEARFRKEWREAFYWLAKQARIPKLASIEMEVRCVYPNRKGWLDIGNAYPSAKAALDGIVDAGVIVDDREPYFRGMMMRPSRLATSAGLEVVVHACNGDADHITREALGPTARQLLLDSPPAPTPLAPLDLASTRRGRPSKPRRPGLHHPGPEPTS